MPLMKMPRNWTVRTTSGHVIRFRKNVEVNVPDDFAVIEECRKFAAEYVDASEEQPLPDEEALGFTPVPKTPAERRTRILTLLGEMKDNQAEHRNHFTAASLPSIRYLQSALGFDVRADEIKDLWTSLVYVKKEDGED